MSDSTLVVWDEVLTDYDHGPGHPLRPVRLELTIALARSLGVLRPARRHDRPAAPRPPTTCSSWCTTRPTSAS